MGRTKKHRRKSGKTSTSPKKSCLYYSSLVIFAAYLLLSVGEVSSLLKDTKRFVEIPLVLLALFASTVLPYLALKYLSKRKVATLKHLHFAAKTITLLWLLLILLLLVLKAGNYCIGFACYYPVIPIIWFFPNIVLAALLLFVNRKK